VVSAEGIEPSTCYMVIQNGHFRFVDEMIVEGVQARRGNRCQATRDASRPWSGRAHSRATPGSRPPSGVTVKDLTNECGKPLGLRASYRSSLPRGWI